jgi:hypothetical protein
MADEIGTGCLRHDDLKAMPGKTDQWEGVRNFSAQHDAR